MVKSNQRRRGGSKLEVELDGEKVEESIQERILGIIMNRSLLDWSNQLTKVQKECAQKLSGLKLGGRCLNFKEARDLEGYDHQQDKLWIGELGSRPQRRSEKIFAGITEQTFEVDLGRE